MSVGVHRTTGRPVSALRRLAIALAAQGTRHWPFRRGAYRLACLAATPRQVSMAFRRPFFGRWYEGDLSNYADWWVYFFGAYERDEVALLRKLARIERGRGRRPVVYLDVGANLGHHVLAVAPLVDHVIAVEPFPEFQATLRRRTATLPSIDIVAAAFSDRRESRRYCHYEPTQTGHFSAGAEGEAFDLAPGDELISSPVSIVKIDVDGFEDRVLAGLQETLRRHRPWLLVEWTPGGHAGPAPLPYPDSVAFHHREGRWHPLARLPSEGSAELLIAPKERLPLLAAAKVIA